MQQMLENHFTACTQRLKSLLNVVRKVTVCLDDWSMTNLSASYLGISVCFYDPTSAKVRYVVLELAQLQHPHTADVLADHLECCLNKWGIPSKRVLMILSDNGSNMVKAIKLLNDRHEEQITEQGDEGNDNSTENEDDSEADDEDGQGAEVLELDDMNMKLNNNYD